jgi:hypothetical protein
VAVRTVVSFHLWISEWASLKETEQALLWYFAGRSVQVLSVGKHSKEPSLMVYWLSSIVRNVSEDFEIPESFVNLVPMLEFIDMLRVVRTPLHEYWSAGHL